MSIIAAMGAEHMDHQKLMAVVATFNHPINPINRSIVDAVTSKYGPMVGNNVKYKNRLYIAEEKFDGHSYIVPEGRFIPKNPSSNGGYLDKTDKLPQLSGIMRHIYNTTGIDVHVELYKPGGTSDDVTSIMGCDTDKAIERQRIHGGLHCMWVDIRQWMGQSVTHEPYYVRRAIMEYAYETYVKSLGFDQYIHIAPVSLDPINDFRRIVGNGGEGLIFKNTDATYNPGKKPANNWIKAKKEITLDVVILDLNGGGSGKNKDLFKSISVGLYFPDKKGIVPIGDIHSGISDELRKDMYLDFQSYKGRVIEVDAMEYNGKRLSLRHGRLKRFRDDKFAGQCTEDGIRVKVNLI